MARVLDLLLVSLTFLLYWLLLKEGLARISNTLHLSRYTYTATDLDITCVVTVPA